MLERSPFFCISTTISRWSSLIPTIYTWLQASWTLSLQYVMNARIILFL